MVKRIKNNKKGFTLVEVIVVLVILAILAAISIPALTGYIDEAKDAAAISYGRNILVAAQTLATIEYATTGLTTGTGITDDAIEKLTAIDNVKLNEKVGLDANGKVISFKVLFSGDGSMPGSSSKTVSYTIDGGFTVS